MGPVTFRAGDVSLGLDLVGFGLSWSPRPPSAALQIFHRELAVFLILVLPGLCLFSPTRLGKLLLLVRALTWLLNPSGGPFP